MPPLPVGTAGEKVPMLLDVKECPSKVIGVSTAFVTTPTTVVVKVAVCVGFCTNKDEICDLDKKATAFVVAKKAISNDATTIDTTIILLINLAFLFC